MKQQILEMIDKRIEESNNPWKEWESKYKIESLKELRQEIEKLNEWISAEERMPEYGVEVLGYDGIFQSVVELWKHEDGDYFVECQENMETKITHWMPLPPSP